MNGRFRYSDLKEKLLVVALERMLLISLPATLTQVGGFNVNIHDVLDYLKAELGRLDGAITALEGSSPRRGRPPKSGSRKKTMSADARKRIGLAMKLAWAKRKRASVPKKAAKKAAASAKKSARKPMSPAARQKLAALMRARWAQKKKAGARTL